MGDHADPDSRLLDDFARRHSSPCPAHEDPFDWSAEALDDLARLVTGVGPTVTQVSGRPSTQIERRVQDLVTAIVAHRNSLMRDDATRHVA